jgi:hypothetical protein
MGQLSSRHKRSHSVKIASKLKQIIICPFCSKAFDNHNNYIELNNHLQECGNTYLENKENDEIYSPSEDEALNQLIFNDINEYKNNIYFNGEKSFDFESKIDELHREINKKKISWVEGSCPIVINRSNFLEESINKIQDVNIYKEWKISFIGETNYDAGGIMREWYTTLFKALEKDNLKLFIKSDTDDYSYIINPFLKRIDKNFKYFDFIGKLMAKALIDNITVNICFNKLIYKMILQEPIEFNELVFINKPVYDSIQNLKNTQTTSGVSCTELGVYYNLEMKDTNDKIHTLDMINFGREIPVEDIDDYINKRIDFLYGLYEPFIKRIRDSLYNIISKEVIQIFTSDQLELLLNGRPFIDIEDWKQFCEYREPYNNGHYIILWFWEILSQLSQKELSNLLMFSTGSSRVPLGGFASLESNRGSNAKFTFECIPYVPNKKNYIKAHTCFNRLDIPLFNDKNELKEAILFVCNNEILGFGID